jgi:hypothetical protein
MERLNKIKFGMVAPAGEDPKRLIDFIVRAEGSKFDSFWAGDHMVFMRPVIHDHCRSFDNQKNKHGLLHRCT